MNNNILQFRNKWDLLLWSQQCCLNNNKKEESEQFEKWPKCRWNNSHSAESTKKMNVTINQKLLNKEDIRRLEVKKKQLERKPTTVNPLGLKIKNKNSQLLFFRNPKPFRDPFFLKRQTYMMTVGHNDRQKMN